MSIKNQGTMIIISSPSGAGKTTLTKLLSERLNFHISISHTTRKPRENEIEAKDYFFLSEKEFQEMVIKDRFIEYAKVFDNFYGTSKDQVIEKLESGKNVIFDIDWQGAKQIREKKLKFNLLTFFVLPPSKEELIKRLSNREKENSSIIQRRMRDFDNDVKHWIDYDCVVVNDDKEECFNEINKNINSFNNGAKLDNKKEYILEHIEKLTN